MLSQGQEVSVGRMIWNDMMPRCSFQDCAALPTAQQMASSAPKSL